MPVVGTADLIRLIMCFSLAPGISDFVMQIECSLFITLVQFLCMNTPSSARLSESLQHYIKLNQCRNINLLSIVVLS